MYRYEFKYNVLLLCLLMAACTQVQEKQTAVLEPAATATYKNNEISAELQCNFEQGEIPPTIAEADLGEGEIGTGFRNWMRREAECVRNHSIVIQGLVRFNTRPLPPLDEIVIQKAELQFYTRPLPTAENPANPDPSRSFEETVFPEDCPAMKLAAESWEPGFHRVKDRGQLVQTKNFPGIRITYPLGFPDEQLHVVDVGDVLRDFIQQGKPHYEFAFQPEGDVLYDINDMYCLMIVGGFELRVVYDRVTEPFR